MSKTWAEPPDGGNPYRTDDQRLVLETRIDSISIRAEDDVVQATVSAPNVDQAAKAAEDAVFRLFSLRATVTEGVHRIVVKAFEVRQEGVALREPVTAWTQIYIYDIEGLKAELCRAAAQLGGMETDSRLGQALRYFSLGDDLAYATPKRARDEYIEALAPVRFLQYWKALTTIVGDPSKERDHQSRPKGLGLGRQFFRHQVQPLHDLRNSFGVAHIADPDVPAIVSQSDVTRCRGVAGQAIVGYAESKGGTVSRDSHAATE